MDSINSEGTLIGAPLIIGLLSGWKLFLSKLAKGTHGGGGKIKIKLYTYNLFKIKSSHI
jgi:hypothetical protein